MAATWVLDNMLCCALLMLLFDLSCCELSRRTETYQNRKHTKRVLGTSTGDSDTKWPSASLTGSVNQVQSNINAILPLKVTNISRKIPSLRKKNFHVGRSQDWQTDGIQRYIETHQHGRGATPGTVNPLLLLGVLSAPEENQGNWKLTKTGDVPQPHHNAMALKRRHGLLIRAGLLSPLWVNPETETHKLIESDQLAEGRSIPKALEPASRSRTWDWQGSSRVRILTRNERVLPQPAGLTVSEETAKRVLTSGDTPHTSPQYDTKHDIPQSNLQGTPRTVNANPSATKWSLTDKLYGSMAQNVVTGHSLGHKGHITEDQPGIMGLLLSDNSNERFDRLSDTRQSGNEGDTGLKWSQQGAHNLMLYVNTYSSNMPLNIGTIDSVKLYEQPVRREYTLSKPNAPLHSSHTKGKSGTTSTESIELPPTIHSQISKPRLDVDKIWSIIHRRRVRRDDNDDSFRKSPPSPSATIPVSSEDGSESLNNTLESDSDVVQSGDMGSIPDDLSDVSLSYRAVAKNNMKYVDQGRDLTRSGTFGSGHPDGDHKALSHNPEEQLHSGDFSEGNDSTDPRFEVTSSAPDLTTDELPETFLLFERGNVEPEPENLSEPVDPESEYMEPEPSISNTTEIIETVHNDDSHEILAEPYPEWYQAKQLYGASFEFHVYFFGISFAILAIYTLVCMIILRRKRNLLSRGYFMSLNAMLLIIGVTRAIHLLVDGYDSHKRFPPVVAYILINLTFPAITSAFSILFLAILKATRMKLMSTRIEKPAVLIGIILFHFALSIVVDITVGIIYTAKAMFLVCQIAFVIWGLFIFCGYLYLFWILYRNKAREQNENNSRGLDIGKHTLGGVAPTGAKGSSDILNPEKPKKWKFVRSKVMLTLALKVTLATAILGILIIGVVIYGMVGVFNFMSDESPDAWPFYGFNFCMRLIELGMCTTMSFVATQPLRYKGGSRRSGPNPDTDCMRIWYFTPCYRLRVEADSDQDASWSTDSRENGKCRSDQVSGAERCWLGPETDALQTTPMVNAMLHNTDNRGNTGDSTRSRPTSMLYFDNGFVRFRQDGDSEGDPIASTDDELDFDNGPARYSSIATGSDLCINGGAQRNCDSRRPYLYPNRVRNGHWRSGSRRSGSVPNTPSGWHTPATPRSLCSTDIDSHSDIFSFRPPSSIHLRDSIEKELNFSEFHLRTPDNMLETVESIQESISLPRSPDALRASIYSYATATQDSRSGGAMSLSPGRKLYSAQSFFSSSPSLSCKGLELSGSGWFQRYFWEQFGDSVQQLPSESMDNFLDAEADLTSHTACLPLETSPTNSPAQTPTSGASRNQHTEHSYKWRKTPYCRPR